MKGLSIYSDGGDNAPQRGSFNVAQGNALGNDDPMTCALKAHFNVLGRNCLKCPYRAQSITTCDPRALPWATMKSALQADPQACGRINRQALHAEAGGVLQPPRMPR